MSSHIAGFASVGSADRVSGYGWPPFSRLNHPLIQIWPIKESFIAWPTESLPTNEFVRAVQNKAAPALALVTSSMERAFAELSHPKCVASNAATKEITRNKATSSSVSVKIDGAERQLASGSLLASSHRSFEPGPIALALARTRCVGDVLDLCIVSDIPSRSSQFDVSLAGTPSGVSLSAEG
jgi:hypothetical protein